MMSDIRLNPLVEELPYRLCAETCALARRYLAGMYQSRLQPCGFSLSELNLPDGTPPETVHGKMTLLNAQKCRLNILPEELLAGDAPNIESCGHRIPGYPQNKAWGGYGSSISHVTADFGNAIRLGLSGLEREVRDYKKTATSQQVVFYDALLDVIEAMRIWTRRYIAAYEELLSDPAIKKHKDTIRRIIAHLRNVPEYPPQTFPEAVQSLWSFWEFQRLCGNWSGLGRIDEYLGPYLKNDLDAGKITLDEAREYLAHFWIKGTEWCFGLCQNSQFTPGSGDAQNYQNIILSGVDADGNQIENEVTFLVLDIVEELHISDYPVTVRLNQYTSDKLFRRIADVQLLGGGIVSVYNEPVILRGLLELGIGEREARRFTNDGCWEIQIPGQTRFGYMPKDVLLPLQEVLFDTPELPTSFESLYQAYLTRFRLLRDRWREAIEKSCIPGKRKPSDYPENYGLADVTLSLVMPTCREYGCSYTLDGVKYRVISPHMMGLPDVANSLYAIKKLVFEQKLVALSELVKILRDDWKEHEDLRRRFANSLYYYGNDNPEMDSLMKRIFDDCTGILHELDPVGYIRTPVGVSTFGREISCAPNRLATAFGKNAHEYLAPNLSPTPGTDKSPLTSVLNSYCRMDFTRTPNGCPLDLRLSAGFRKLADASGILAAVLKSFLQQGGLYLQIDTVDPEMLRAAQKEPDRYPNLVVRISGWSTRFASLNEEWQNMIINRTALEC